MPWSGAMPAHSLAVTRIPHSRLTEQLREESSFGTVFSDHMLVTDYADGRWREPSIVPYGPLPLPPAPSAVQYGQAIFEGFKAHALVDGGAALFRPADNYARFARTAERLAMPPVPADLFIDGIAELVRQDRAWVPRREGGALYIRPVAFAIDEALLVRPAERYRFVVITSPVGLYFSGSINLVVEDRYVRAFPGGTGDVKPAGNYAGSLRASLDAQERGYHNVIWLDAIEHRFVEESGLMNIMFLIDGRVVTPPISGTILPGITRDSLLTIFREMGIEVEERPIAIEEVFALHGQGRLSEAAGVGTAATVAPIGRVRFREREIDLSSATEGGLFQRGRERLEAIRTGREDDRHHWLLRV
jgi:branched-chain amino acid aminotransferase